PLDRALVRGFLTEDEIEQRGLARAVRPDQAEAIRARNEERHLGEQFSGAVGLGDIGKRQHGNRRVSGFARTASIVRFRASAAGSHRSNLWLVARSLGQRRSREGGGRERRMVWRLFAPFASFARLPIGFTNY